MYVGPLKETTTHLSMFPNKDTPCGRENEGTQERSHDVPDVVDKKETCFLVCFVQNIRHLVGTSDITTISNDRGNILQISCKTLLKKKQVSLCSANAWIGTHVTFPVILKRCCRFLVVQSFQFELATHRMYIQGKHLWWSKIQLSWVLMLYYPYKMMFSAYKSVIVSPCACDLFVSDENHSVRGCLFLAVIFRRFFSVWWLYVEINQSLFAEIICTIYSFIHASTQHNIWNKKQFSTMFYFQLKCITPCMRTFWH